MDDANNEPVHYVEQVVDPHVLHQMTMEGWEVVERFEEDQPISVQETIQPRPDQGHYGTQNYTTQKLGRVALFRIRRRADSPVASLLADVTRLQHAERAAADTIKKLGEELEREKKAHQGTRQSLSYEQEAHGRQRKAREDVEAIKRQLEGDLGKVREHIGRKMFDEILPPKLPASVTP
jgi:hypothetical protein